MRSLARQAGACLVESRPGVPLVFLLRFLAGSLLGVATGPVAIQRGAATGRHDR